MSFALIVFFQKLWFCVNFPLTDMYFSWFVNSNPLFLRFRKPSISSILESKELHETFPSNSVYFVVLFNFWTVFSLVDLLSAAHAGAHAGIVKGVVEGIVEGVVWIVFKSCFSRDCCRISILQTGIPKLKTGCFRDCG